MTKQIRRAGASPDQGFGALPQADTCAAIIAPRDLERLMLTMPPMTEEQAFWLRSLTRAVNREVSHMRRTSRSTFAQVLGAAIGTAVFVFLAYLFMFLALL